MRERRACAQIPDHDQTVGFLNPIIPFPIPLTLAMAFGSQRSHGILHEYAPDRLGSKPHSSPQSGLSGTYAECSNSQVHAETVVDALAEQGYHGPREICQWWWGVFGGARSGLRPCESANLGGREGEDGPEPAGSGE